MDIVFCTAVKHKEKQIQIELYNQVDLKFLGNAYYFAYTSRQLVRQ